MRWSVVTFRAPRDPRTASAWNSSDVVTFWTPNTSGVFQAIGVVESSATTKPARSAPREARETRRTFQNAVKATPTRTAKA
ncbi:MAG: hypothetical protein E6J94_08825 [Methanobacteriota archaeon]|nr:MAG: hypothetical protein E6J94_08825 [Euryarchaeota archaeon]